MRRKLSYIALYFLIAGCVDPANIKVPSAGAYLVVDGLITNEVGPYYVTISHATGLDENLSATKPEHGAVVTIVDDLGTQEPLTEFESGHYRTIHPSFVGQVGRQYYVKIKTTDGREFQSTPEMIIPAGSIDALYYEFEYADAVVNNSRIPVNRFKIYIDATGAANSGNLLRWKWKGTYKIEAFPYDLFPFQGQCRSLPCSGLHSYVDPFDGDCIRVPVTPCLCCICWINEASEIPIVSDDDLVVNGKFKRVFIDNIEVNPRRFYEKYYVEVEQMSVSQTTFDFWRIIEQQKLGASNIFQPLFGKARGNIRSINNQDEVIGLFSASGISRKSIFLNKSEIPYRLAPIDTLIGSCLENPNSSNVKPAFWQ